MTRSNLLAGASALVAASLAFAGVAQADSTGSVTSQVYGGGSTLIGPYLRVVGDCWGNPADLVVQGSYAPYTAPKGFITLGGFNFPGVGVNHVQAQNCATTHNVATSQINYLNAGSGNGELGVFTHDVNTDFGVTTDSANDHQQYPDIQFGAGDYGIGLSEVTAYNNGGNLSQKTGSICGAPTGCSGSVVTILAPNSTVTPSGTTYANPVSQYGAFIEFPISVDAVAIAYSPVYAVYNNAATGQLIQYSFNVKTVNKDGSGGLRLSLPVLCAIMNGAVTNWNDPAITYLNAKTSLKSLSDPNTFSVPIQLDGRSDSSGTTSIFYRALAAQCPTGSSHLLQTGVKLGVAQYETVTYTNAYGAGGGKTLPTALIASSNGGEGANPGLFNTYSGSTSVATAIGTLPSPTSGQTLYHGDLGYIGTDYVLPEANAAVGGVNNYNLNVVDISKNAPNYTTFIEPTSTSALAAFGAGVTAILPPQSNASGAYIATTTGIAANSHGGRAVPSDWVEPIATTYTYTCVAGDASTACTGVTPGQQSASVATPLASPAAATAYPLVGTTNAFLNTCYGTGTNGSTGTNNAVGNAATLKAFFTYYFTGDLVNTASTGLLAKAGFGVLPAPWRNAINFTFFNPKTTGVNATVGLNLNVATAGAGPTSGNGSQCNAVTPGA
jgi:ABC-type phosphate transport system substrate-binding protein